MNYSWYKFFNLTEFQETERVSKEYTLTLIGRGEKTVLVTQGQFVGMTYEDKFFPVNFGQGKNPFVIDDVASYLDSNDDVWLGFADDEEEA